MASKPKKSSTVDRVVKRGIRRSKTRRNLTGWRKDQPDHRDLTFTARRRAKLATKLTLVPMCPPVEDQDALGSCVWNGIAGLLQFTGMEEVDPSKADQVPLPSRLFGYFFGRVEQGTVNEDSGLSIRVGMKVAAKYGFVPETAWPYDIKKFKVKPTQAVIDAAAKNKLTAKQYMRVEQTLSQLKNTLAGRNPIVFGFTVYPGLMSTTTAKTGICPNPGKNERPEGGHCVVIVGYDDTMKFPDGSVGGFLCRNSWGTKWGQKGYFWMSYAYITNPKLASDFWTVVDVPNPTVKAANRSTNKAPAIRAFVGSKKKKAA